MKLKCRIFTVLIIPFLAICLLSCEKRGAEVIQDENGASSQVSQEINDFELEYSLRRFPSPIEPMSYVVKIDNEGLLSKEYINAENYEGDYNKKVRQLSPSEFVEIINVVQKNGFFNLPENVDGKTNITDQDARYLTITQNGVTHICNGYNTKNRKYLSICAYIEELAQDDIS